ncbi:MAG: hypothetical protein ACI4RG_01870 [Huintestinicola sp.]
MMLEFSMREIAEMFDAEKGEDFTEEAIDLCEGCGAALYEGDTAYQIGSDLYCERCCTCVEMR